MYVASYSYVQLYIYWYTNVLGAKVNFTAQKWRSLLLDTKIVTT